MNKFIPENSATVEYNEAFYLRTKFIVAIAVLSAVVPFIGVIVAVLIGLKGKNFSSYREQPESVAPRALASANDKAQKIVDEAQKKLRVAENEIERKKREGEKIISDATQKAELRLQVLNAEIENKEETTARIINDAMWQAEQHKRSARRELKRVQAEIDKREFYLSEVKRIKENISALPNSKNILYTLTSSKLDDALAAVREVTTKYLNIAREGNQTISSTLATFIGEIKSLFLDAVKIEYEYYVKREAARQEQLELRAKMREEAEEQRRLKEQQEQMEREASKFTAEIEKLCVQGRHDTTA